MKPEDKDKYIHLGVMFLTIGPCVLGPTLWGCLHQDRPYVALGMMVLSAFGWLILMVHMSNWRYDRGYQRNKVRLEKERATKKLN